MLSIIILIVLIPIALYAIIMIGYVIFISWALLFAICGNKWCQNFWRNL
jgi:hypothetical protein